MPRRIKGHATHSQEPQWFTTAPIPAIRKLLDKVGWSVGDVDLFEINEAFAVVAMAAQRDLGIPREKLNINGGACALGHPIGATGARLIVTLLHALEAQNLKRGVAALCIGGGEATAIAVERIVALAFGPTSCRCPEMREVWHFSQALAHVRMFRHVTSRQDSEAR